MVNDVRTLLANLDGYGAADGAGEEYTDPSFRAVDLPPYLAAIRAVLFGVGPDRQAVLYRTRQYLACLHASSLAGHATSRDPRITYLPFDHSAIAMQPSLSSTPVGHTHAIDVAGEPPGPDASGRVRSSWSVYVLS